MDTRAAILTLLLAVPACSEGGAGEGGDQDPNLSSSLRDRLSSSTQTLELQNEYSDLEVTATMGDQIIRAELVMTQGATSVRAEGNGDLVVEDISLSLEDVVLHHELLPPEGVRLMNINASLDGSMDARTTWIGDDELVAETTGNLVVDWAIMNDQGQPAPLAPQPLEAVPFSIHLERSSDGYLNVTVTGSVTGRFWTWADYIELSDLEFELSSSTPLTPPEDEIVQ